ncbi:MAG: radical SAM protein [Defluviitaleaceae bacterium]|nr:radical SAM protein [Defluviitaleaceae bacterium]
MTIFYRLDGASPSFSDCSLDVLRKTQGVGRAVLYVNITNSCPCDCIFCIRKLADGMNPNESLWLEREPTVAEIKAAFEARGDLRQIGEIVFCGYGEPMMRANDVIELARYFKSVTSIPMGTNANGVERLSSPIPIRINTNGLVRLVAPDFCMESLRAVDCVSVSLNADNADEYMRVTRPRVGGAARQQCPYEEMLAFARDAKEYTRVVFSVVGEVLSREQVERCREVAEGVGVGLRVR